jgi:hypothetical protein
VHISRPDSYLNVRDSQRSDYAARQR